MVNELTKRVEEEIAEKCKINFDVENKSKDELFNYGGEVDNITVSRGRVEWKVIDTNKAPSFDNMKKVSSEHRNFEIAIITNDKGVHEVWIGSPAGWGYGELPWRLIAESEDSRKALVDAVRGTDVAFVDIYEAMIKSES